MHYPPGAVCTQDGSHESTDAALYDRRLFCQDTNHKKTMNIKRDRSDSMAEEPRDLGDLLEMPSQFLVLLLPSSRAPGGILVCNLL